MLSGHKESNSLLLIAVELVKSAEYNEQTSCTSDVSQIVDSIQKVTLSDKPISAAPNTNKGDDRSPIRYPPKLLNEVYQSSVSGDVSQIESLSHSQLKFVRYE